MGSTWNRSRRLDYHEKDGANRAVPKASCQESVHEQKKEITHAQNNAFPVGEC